MPKPDPTITGNEKFLRQHAADIQANIFEPHRCEHLLLLFLRFDGDASEYSTLRHMLRTLAENSEGPRGFHITSIEAQRNISKKKEKDRDLFCNLYLAADGLRALLEDDTPWQPVLDHLQKDDDLKSKEPAETAPGQRTHWEPSYRDHFDRVHAVLLLGHPLPEALRRIRSQLIEEFFPQAGLTLLIEERGQVYRQVFFRNQRNGFTVEHFGYADGLSNPWVTEADTMIKGKPRPARNWNPVVPVESFLVQEPGEDGSWGSYLVYRKYQQHLNAFMEATAELGKKLGLPAEDAGALAFGRRRNGTSLELPGEGTDSPELSDFVFPAKGSKCPFFAHTRKMNPRNHPEGELPKTLEYPIIRRGITYGPRQTLYHGGFDPDNLPEHPVGLLFMSFQKNIDHFHQLLGQAGGKHRDPLLGDYHASGAPFEHRLEDLDGPITGFGDFATLRGGLNLFAPSLSFFKSLTPGTRSLGGASPENPERMETIHPHIPLFGRKKLAWLDVIKYYNDYKVGYDGAIIAHEQGYTVPLPAGGNVPIKHQQSLRGLMAGMPNLTNAAKNVGLQFEVPLRKNHYVNLQAILTTWNEEEILARCTLENIYFKDKVTKSPQVLEAEEGDEFGYIQVVLTKDLTGDPDHDGQSIVDRINFWCKKASKNPTNCLFVLRVKQVVWSMMEEGGLTAIEPDKMECRDDSIILVVEDDQPPT